MLARLRLPRQQGADVKLRGAHGKPLRIAPRQFQYVGRNIAVINNHICFKQFALGLEGQQFRIAGASAHN